MEANLKMEILVEAVEVMILEMGMMMMKTRTRMKKKKMGMVKIRLTHIKIFLEPWLKRKKKNLLIILFVYIHQNHKKDKIIAKKILV